MPAPGSFLAHANSDFLSSNAGGDDLKSSDPCNKSPADESRETNWFLKGHEEGFRFAREEADFADLAAIHRAGGIPAGWDLFRAELLQKHLGEKGFDFQQYAAGFAGACLEFFDEI